jgi:hypothetical protein
MSVLVRPASILLSCAALAAAAGLAIGPASAATSPSWTITKGGAVTATTKSLTIEDVTQKADLSCKASTIKGRLKSGKLSSGTSAGTVTSAAVTGCSVAGFAITVKAGHLPWHLNLVSYNAAKGVTTGTLTGIHLTFAVPAAGCTAVVDGTGSKADNGKIQVTYANNAGKLATLTAGSSLRLYSVKNCMGVVSNGDKIAIIATYALTPKQKITRS